MARVYGIVVLSSVFLFLGCSQPPELPNLPNPDSNSAPEIALRDSLTANDVRNLFKAVNQKGQFSNLSQLFATASDNDLVILGNAANRYLYQEALNKNSLVALLKNRVQKKSFSENLSILKSACSEQACQTQIRFFKLAASHPAFPKLIQRNSYVFSDEWKQTISKLLAVSNSSTSPEPATKLNMKNDLSKLVGNPNFEDLAIQLFTSLQKTELGKSFFLTLKDLQENYSSEAFSDLATQIKLTLVSTQNQPSILMRWLRLAKALNRPSQGLFLHAQETLNTDEGQTLVRLLSERFDPLILKGASGFIRETLKEPTDDETLDVKFWAKLPRKNPTDEPTPQLKLLVQKIQYALDKMESTSQTLKDPKKILNSYLLALWFEQFARENSENISAIPSNNFSNELWSTPIKAVSFSINLLSLDPTGKPLTDHDGKLILSLQVEQDLKFLELTEFAEDLKYLIKQNSFGPTLTKISIGEDTPNLDKALLVALNTLHRDRPIAEPVPFISSLIYMISRPDSGTKLTIADFESNNMLESVEKFLAGVSFPQLRKAIDFLFNDLQIGNISEEDRERLKSLYPKNPECAELLDLILVNLQVIHDLDNHSLGHMSLLEVYHKLLTNSRHRDLTGLSAIFTFLETTGMLENGSPNAKFPSILGLLSDAESIAALIQALAATSSEQQTLLLHAMNSVFGSSQTDFKEFLSFSKEAIIPNLSAVISIKALLENHSTNLSLTPEESAWLKRVIESEAFQATYQVLVRILASQDMNALINELEKLELEGELENGFKVLSNIQSDRMQRLALTFWEWEKSRELRPFFSLLKFLTNS